jgi:hypothetical protein
MTNWFADLSVRLALGVMLVSFAACGTTQTTQSTLTMDLGYRQVKAVIDGVGGISHPADAPDTAVVSFGGRKLVVEKERVLLDGKEQAKLPAGAKSVEVEIKGGKLTVRADGAAVDVVGEGSSEAPRGAY